jgi:hypothetical protein
MRSFKSKSLRRVTSFCVADSSGRSRLRLSCVGRSVKSFNRRAVTGAPIGRTGLLKLGRSADSPSPRPIFFLFPNNGDLILCVHETRNLSTVQPPVWLKARFHLNNDRPIWVDLKSNAAVWVGVGHYLLFDQKTCLRLSGVIFGISK